MDKYFTQAVKLEDISAIDAAIFDYSKYLSIASMIPMTFSRACELYGHFTTVPLTDCDMYALSNNGILYNTKWHKLITPELRFNEYGFPESAQLPLPNRGRMIDVGELVIKSRFRIDPTTVKIIYTLNTDNHAVFMDLLVFEFKEPEVIPIPPEYGITVRKFYDDYFISRNSITKYMVSQSGALYDPEKQQFMPIYLQKIYSKADNTKVLRPVIYPFGYPVPLLDYVIEEWSGFDVPRQYTAINTSGILSKASLKEFTIRDLRSRSMHNPSQYNMRLQEKRMNSLNQFRADVENGINETMDLIRKYSPK